MQESYVDIRPAHLAIVQKILHDVLPRDANIWVFGSRAKWTTKDSSDLDIAIDAGRPLTRKEESMLTDAFEESDLPYKVDFVDLNTVSPSFREIIERDKVELPKANIPEKWELLTIGDITKNLDSKRIPVKESERKKGPYPYYGASGIVDYVDSYIFDGLHLLVAEDGENLKTRKTPIAFLANGKFWVNNHAHVLTSNEKSDIRFVNYFLECADISSYITGLTIPGHLTKER